MKTDFAKFEFRIQVKKSDVMIVFKIFVLYNSLK